MQPMKAKDRTNSTPYIRGGRRCPLGDWFMQLVGWCPTLFPLALRLLDGLSFALARLRLGWLYMRC